MSLSPFPGSRFPSTRRSVILALASDDASERERAFDTLVGCYWKPLYKYARLHWRRSAEDAEDLTQSFFVRAFEKETLASYDPARAGFRTFLRLLFDRFLANEHKASLRIKRGGGAIALDFDAAEAELGRDDGSPSITPEELFQREWVRSVFSLAVERLRAWCEAEAKPIHFELFETYDLDGDRISYRALAERYRIPETQVTNWLAAARRRFRELVLEALREVTASDREFRDEARALLGVEM